ncbi:hypothetical protein BH11MYX4_BH11MYX4_32140 [soil metagenome]
MVHLFASNSIVLTFTAAAAFATLTACASSDSGGSSSGGGTSGSGQSSSGTSGSGNGGGSCSGDIANCPVGTLSAAQQNDMCSILSAAIDDPPGTKLECKQGGDSQYIVVNSKADCIAKPAPAACKVTVTQLVGCFKSAKKDACPAFATGGACAPLFDPASGCL